MIGTRILWRTFDHFVEYGTFSDLFFIDYYTAGLSLL